MKTVAKVGLSVCLLAAAGMMYGCGDSDSTPAEQTGKVVKAPVKGAKIKFEGFDNYSTRSNASGVFGIRHPGAKMTCSGGTYVDLATNTEKSAPDMQAPADAQNITPLTTAVATAATPAAADALKAALVKLGISYDAPLDAVNATGTNRAAIAINEILGNLMADPAVNSVSVASFVTNLVTRINLQVTTATDLSNPDSIKGIVAAAATAVGGSVNTSVSATVDAIVAEVKTLPVNAPLPTPTGTTGGTGGATGGTGTGF